jgi:hypothetical protein
MMKTIAEKLAATILEATDLGGYFPASSLKERLALDVRVEGGALSVGKRVLLRGPAEEEDLEILGIEMLRDAHDTSVVRVQCSKPKVLSFPIGKVEGWMLAER